MGVSSSKGAAAMTGYRRHNTQRRSIGRLAAAFAAAVGAMTGIAVQPAVAQARGAAIAAECSIPTVEQDSTVEQESTVEQDSTGNDCPPDSTTTATVTPTLTAGVNDTVLNDTVELAPRYDLALVMRLARNQVFFLGNTIRYEIEIANHGAIASGSFSVQHAVATGMSFVDADRGGFSLAGTVTWIDLPELQPGEHRRLTVALRLDAVDLASYRNIAEISADSGDDWNSVPDNNPFNDSVVDNDDVDELVVGDSDDHDIADVAAAQVHFDNQQRVMTAAPVTDELASIDRSILVAPNEFLASSQPSARPMLPATGRGIDELLLMAVALTSAGLVLMAVRRSQMISGSQRER